MYNTKYPRTTLKRSFILHNVIRGRCSITLCPFVGNIRDNEVIYLSEVFHFEHNGSGVACNTCFWPLKDYGQSLVCCKYASLPKNEKIIIHRLF